MGSRDVNADGIMMIWSNVLLDLLVSLLSLPDGKLNLWDSHVKLQQKFLVRVSIKCYWTWCAHVIMKKGPPIVQICTVVHASFVYSNTVSLAQFVVIIVLHINHFYDMIACNFSLTFSSLHVNYSKTKLFFSGENSKSALLTATLAYWQKVCPTFAKMLSHLANFWCVALSFFLCFAFYLHFTFKLSFDL